MKIGDNNEYIELIVQERVPESLPTSGDIRVKVCVQLQEFRGIHENVWLDKIELNRLIKELITVNKTRQGKIYLKSMSPDEFWVEIRSIDSVGHFELQVQLKRYQYSRSTKWSTSIAGGFELDVSQLESIINGFSALVE